MTEHPCKTSKDFNQSLEFHRDLSAMLKQELEQLRAENLQMREALSWIGACEISLPEHCPSHKVIGETANKALDLKHTAHLAGQWELMEKVVREARYFHMNQNVGNALKALDEHIAKGKE